MTQFHTQKCRKCHGSGKIQMSYHPHPFACNLCGGGGRVLSKRGREQREIWRNLASVPVSSLSAGDQFVDNGKRFTVVSVSVDSLNGGYSVSCKSDIGAAWSIGFGSESAQVILCRDKSENDELIKAAIRSVK